MSEECPRDFGFQVSSEEPGILPELSHVAFVDSKQVVGVSVLAGTSAVGVMALPGTLVVGVAVLPGT